MKLYFILIGIIFDNIITLLNPLHIFLIAEFSILFSSH